LIEVQARSSRQRLNHEISRAQGIFKETVRYRYHKFFLDKGITVQAVPSYSKLGFRRLVLVARLATKYDRLARRIFDLLSQLAYLHSYTRVLLTGQYIIHVAVPADLSRRCGDLYRSLCEAGVFSSLEVLEFEEIRNPPMKTSFFDFVAGAWKFDWSVGNATKVRPPPPVLRRPRPETYDRIDLLILKELDKNAASTLVKMAAAVDVNLSSVEFHYRDHVKSKGLIRGYRLIWQGTRPDIVEGKTTSRKDTYIEFTLMLAGSEQAEVEELMSLLNGMPFLWSEAYGPTYCAEVFVPNSMVQGLLEFIDPFANKVGERLKLYVMDQSHAMRYVIAYSLFDGVARKWHLEEDAVLKAVGGLLQ
jgi:DNA-binding Lrp family transcriptional regulator